MNEVRIEEILQFMCSGVSKYGVILFDSATAKAGWLEENHAVLESVGCSYHTHSTAWISTERNVLLLMTSDLSCAHRLRGLILHKFWILGNIPKHTIEFLYSRRRSDI